jgi:hypothetical protein
MDEMVHRLHKVLMMNDERYWFERGIRFSKKNFSWLLKNNEKTQQKLKKYFPSEYRENLIFLGIDAEPFDILIFAYTSAFLSFCLLFVFDLCVLCSYGWLYGNIDGLTIALLSLLLVIVPLVLLNLIANYPKTIIRYAQIHSLGDVPEILSYLVMYLKLVPNLENSVKFAASESSTSLAYDLRKLVWDLEIRVYHGIDDALTSFAQLWGRWSEHFKRSLHLIRSSIHEHDEASRIVTLDRALDVSLEGTREMMNLFAHRLHQPTILLYSMGIMIPLSLVAMLPAAGLVGLHITVFQIFILYDILLPLVVFLYTRKILLSRPATFTPCFIPSDHPTLAHINKRKLLFMSFCIGILLSLPGFLFFIDIPLSSSTSMEILPVILRGLERVNSYVPMTLFFIWGSAATVTLYCLSVYRPYKKVRDEIKQMEKEFSDALYILGKRISEEKSPEESFLYAAHTMEGAQMADVFRRTSYNLSAMHTNFRDALFHDEFGSLRMVYSHRIKAILRLFVESAQKSQRAVSASLINIADHLKQLQGVENKITEMLSELTSTLRSTVLVFAPLIAGITLAITGMISKILSSFRLPDISSSMTETTISLPGNPETLMLEHIQPNYFVLVIGIYLIELVFLLTRFTNGINEGDDKAVYMYNIGRTMPISILVFSLTVILGQYFFLQIVPTG